jgi:APA family basic amino acid/polyamine antiporter
VAIGSVLSGGWYGILQSAGLLFFAFAGYARIATMGEEVRDPGRTIPRAIIIALSIVLVLYALVAVALVFTLGPVPLASSHAPLTDLLAAQGVTAPIPLVRAGAAVAALGALLALVAGIGRTTLAMARHSDLPAWLGAVHPRYRVPHHAEIALALVVSVLVLTIDLRGAIGFSSFGVLLYYFVANVSAFTQQPGNRRYPKALQVLGASGCLVLVATLPPVSIVAGLVVVAAGVFYRLARLRRRPARRRD